MNISPTSAPYVPYSLPSLLVSRLHPGRDQSTPDVYSKTYEDGNLTISADYDLQEANTPGIPKRVTINTGNENDRIHIRLGSDNKVTADVNGESYPLNLENEKALKTLLIKTNGGNDRVTVDEDVKNTVAIYTGDGDDHVKSGGGLTFAYLGNGDDEASLGSGGGMLEGQGGNDFLTGGLSRYNSLDGGAGNNIMRSGTGGGPDQATHIAGRGDRDTMTSLSGRFSITSSGGASFITTEGKGDIRIGGGKNTINTTSEATLSEKRDSDVITQTDVPAREEI